MIELLVVVAIIGLIASLAYVNVRDSQLKARDSNVRENLLGVLDAAEFQIGETVTNYDFVCDEADGTLSNSGDFGRLENAIMQNNGGNMVKCIEGPDPSKTGFAVSSPLLYLRGKHWCVDSRGVSKVIDSEITTYQCP